LLNEEIDDDICLATLSSTSLVVSDVTAIDGANEISLTISSDTVSGVADAAEMNDDIFLEIEIAAASCATDAHIMSAEISLLTANAALS